MECLQWQHSWRKTDCTVCISGLFNQGELKESHCRPVLQYELSHDVGVQGAGTRDIMRIICDCAWVKLRVAYKAVQFSSRITSGRLGAAPATGPGTWRWLRKGMQASLPAACTRRRRETLFQCWQRRAPYDRWHPTFWANGGGGCQTQAGRREIGKACWGKWYLI